MIRTLLLLFTCTLFLHAIPLAKVYSDDMNVTGWLMSEKLDGIRGVWNGKTMKSKNGTSIHAPEWFLNALPPFAVDGELWSKRGDFENIQSIVLDKTPGKNWQEISYHIFEAPFEKMDFEKRMAKVRAWLNNHPAAHIRVIEQTPCKSKAHLAEFLNAIESKGGEGVVLRDPNALYEDGRNDTFLKVKSFQDAEAKIIGYKAGQGKYEGMVGSLHVVLQNGVTFFIGSGLSDALRKNPPKIGTFITFKYCGFTKNGKPKFPSFLRVRDDYAWQSIDK